MAKMDDESLLSFLQAEEEEAGDYVWGKLADDREKALREYQRMPYGDEEDGRSEFVTSDVNDTIEWVLPSLLKIFTSGDQAVSFDPSSEEDVQSAEQATEACNYVFYKQNNGFLILHSAFKDALILKNAAVMWRWKEVKTTETNSYKGLSDDQLALVMQQLKAQKLEPEIVTGTSQEVLDSATGLPVTVNDVRIRTLKKRGFVCVEAFPPDELLVKRLWTSPLLDDCPYVCRMMPVTLSELREMGYDVDADDLQVADRVESSSDRMLRESDADASGNSWAQNPRRQQTEDESRTEGWLRIEYVLVDYDGDGISERRRVVRLHDKILENEPCSHVPIATSSPVLRSHRWDGMSLAELVSDIQRLNTTVTRGMLDSMYLALNPRKKVLTDRQGAPLANIDDLLDTRVGGILRQQQVDAITEEQIPWVGAQAFPMLEYVDRVRMNRTGVNYLSSGLDANAINKTARGAQIVDSRMQERIELVARVFAECLVKPVFLGILKLLTEHQMEKLAFRLRNKFVAYDPQEWRDQYDMTVNVGLGTGNKDQQLLHLQGIEAAQMAAAQGGGMGVLVTPKHIYNLQAAKVKLAGFQNVGDFWQDPGDGMPQQQPQPSPEEIKAKADIQKQQADLQADAQRFQAQAQLDREAEERKHAFEAQQRELDRLADIEKARIQAQTQIAIARERQPAEQAFN